MFNKRFDGKPLGMFAMLLMVVCLSMFAASREGSWTLNPSDFRYDMSLYFKVVPPQYEDPDAYEIGAFVGDECRGTAQRLDLPDGSSCLYMRLRSNVASGEEVEFLARERATGLTTVLKDKGGMAFTFDADKMVGLPSEPYEMTPWFTVTVQSGEHGSVTTIDSTLPWGTVLDLEASPEEGYAFLEWSDGSTENPRQITVESDLNLTANFEIKALSLMLIVDGEVYEIRTVNYGDPIELPEMPEREGYTFSGWGEVPETMPAHEVVLTGTYDVNIYRLQLILDGEVYREYGTAYGTPLNREDFDGATPPDREGYTFDGWGEVPETMPARDLLLSGSFSLNAYRLTLILNGEVNEILTVPYGEPLPLPTPPEQEGLTWDGWDNAPETMPAHDLELTGDYEFNGYRLTIILDGEVYEMKTLLYGSAIELPEMPEREGYTFSGWSDVPAKMPARDLEVVGSYDVNSYLLTLIVDGEVYSQENVEYGTELKLDSPEEKEGYTFSGWGEVLKTMPAHDLSFEGQYVVNTYTLILLLDNTVYEMLNVEYGQKLEIPDAPEKEGFTFLGWHDVPETMPADNLQITGEYTVNHYTLTIYINGEVYSVATLAYGETITLPEPEAPEGMKFVGWEGAVPESMPAHDVEVYGLFDYETGVSFVSSDRMETLTVSTLDGKVVLRGVKDVEEVKTSLQPGLYIVNGKKVLVK